MNTANEIKKIVKEEINLPSFINKLAVRVGLPLLEESAKKTSGTWDDAMVGLATPLVSVIRVQLERVWDKFLEVKEDQKS